MRLAPHPISPGANLVGHFQVLARLGLGVREGSPGQRHRLRSGQWRGAPHPGILLSHMGQHDAGCGPRKALGTSTRSILYSRRFPHRLPSTRTTIRPLWSSRDELLSCDPEFWVGHYQLAQAGVSWIEAIWHSTRSRRLGCSAVGTARRSHSGAICLAKVGRAGEAREVMNTLEAVSRERYVPPYATALVYGGLGEHDQALDWLDRAYDAHDVHLVLMLVDPKWDDFRCDGRFVALIKRCGFTAGTPRNTARPPLTIRERPACS